MSKKISVLGVGNAIVDVLSQTEDDFLKKEELTKGSMKLIDAKQAKSLYGKMGSAIEVSGGSAANTIAALASLGSKTGFIGKVANDQLGEVFKHDMKAMGVEFSTPSLIDGEPTARSLILVTPDAERTMCTFLGASICMSSSDINEDLITKAEVIYLEGYLFDKESAKKAFLNASEIAQSSGTKVALTLSDTFCVERHRAEFLELIKNNIDVLFANEDEIKSLYETNNLDEAISKVQEHCPIVAITLGKQGSIIIKNNQILEIPATPVERIVDTTGAGDLYAAGFLHGYTQGEDMETCGYMGSIAASEILGHMGARPQTNLSKIMEEQLKFTA